MSKFETNYLEKSTQLNSLYTIIYSLSREIDITKPFIYDDRISHNIKKCKKLEIDYLQKFTQLIPLYVKYNLLSL